MSKKKEYTKEELIKYREILYENLALGFTRTQIKKLGIVPAAIIDVY